MTTNLNRPMVHVSLFVTDLSATQSFYDRFFSSKPAKHKPGYLKYELPEPGLVISFIQDSSRAGADFGHLGFRVDSAETLALHLQQAATAGFFARKEEDTRCCYARQNKFWLTDPDGYEWEVYHLIEDVEKNDPEYQMSTEKACC